MEVRSSGGFVFGIQGYEYGEVKPKSITFFMDGTAKVCDHRGNPISEFAGTHAATIAKLKEIGIDWQKLDSAGWPQLPYAELKELVAVPATPFDELMKIRDKSLRADALKLRREVDEARAEEEAAA